MNKVYDIWDYTCCGKIGCKYCYLDTYEYPYCDWLSMTLLSPNRYYSNTMLKIKSECFEKCCYKNKLIILNLLGYFK